MGNDVNAVECRHGLRVVDVVIKNRRVVDQLSNKQLGVGIYKEFIGVKSHALSRIPGSVDSKSVSGPDRHVGDDVVVDILNPMGQGVTFFNEAVGFRAPEDAKFNKICVWGPEGDLGAAIVAGCHAKGIPMTYFCAHSCEFSRATSRSGEPDMRQWASV